MEYNIDIQLKGKQKVNVALSRVTTLVQNVYPSGIVYNRPPLLRETISYAAYDYADLLQRGAFDYTPPVYPKYYQELDLSATNPFTTLKHPNIHGTLDRFTDTQGGQNYTDGWIQDHYTGLEWCIGYFNEMAYSTWNNIMTNNPTINFNGRTGRIPSLNELESIMHRSNGKQTLLYSPFNINVGITALRGIISCNTAVIYSTVMKSLLGEGATTNYGQIGNQGKDLSQMKVLYVRRIEKPLNEY